MNDDFSDSDLVAAPEPPRFLYKYLHPCRIENVLGDFLIRFTPLLNTNDIFEVRSTFDRFFGPRFDELMDEQADEFLGGEGFDRVIREALDSLGRHEVPTSLAKAQMMKITANDGTDGLKHHILEYFQRVIAPHLKGEAARRSRLERMATELVCFSLSERRDNALMWAHYGGNGQGFVVEFDTRHEWFRAPKDTNRFRLQKVTYFDDVLAEPLENPNAAFISKKSEWAYEREWRVYGRPSDADKVLNVEGEEIHLFRFPASAVGKVVVGPKADQNDLDRICAVSRESFPHAGVVKLVPNRMTSRFEEVEV